MSVQSPIAKVRHSCKLSYLQQCVHLCTQKNAFKKELHGLFMFSDGVDFLVEDPVRGDLLPDEIQTVENLDGKYEDGELKG